MSYEDDLDDTAQVAFVVRFRGVPTRLSTHDLRPHLDTIPTLQPVIGEAYSYQPRAVFYGTGAAWSVSSGALPDGLSLSTSTGEITGTLTVDGLLGGTAGTYTIEVTATDSYGSTTREVVLEPQGVAASTFPIVVGLWTMSQEQISGAQMLDLSGSDRHLGIVGSPLEISPGAYGASGGSGLDFRAVDGHYLGSSDAALKITGDISVTWAHRVATTPHFQGIVSVGLVDGGSETSSGNTLYSVAINSSGRLYYFHEHGTGSNETATGTSIVDTSDEWQLGGLTRDVSANSVTMYLDGAEDSDHSYTTDPDGGGNGSFFVGFFSAGSTLQFENGLDQVCVWGGTLTADQHATLELNRQRGITPAEFLGLS